MTIALHARRLMTAALLLAAASISPLRVPAAPVANAQVAEYFHEARLRKLHLVRPDLISYPVSFDIVC